MAVQAQHHSSNLIFLNKRNGKEKDQDLLDQTNMLFNNGGSNQRKRGREPLQSHQFPQVIDLSLLHNYNHPPLNMVVHTGLQLSSGEDRTQKICSSKDVFATYTNRESEELDEFLRTQAEELRRTLVERRKKHYNALLSAMEEPLIRKLREKEAEIERATRRHNELVAREAQMTAEAQAWQKRAMAQEAAAASLQSQLQQAVNKCGGGCVSAQDSKTAEEGLLCDGESSYVDPERMRWPRCKACLKREATVVVLPCRHLSICPGCDRTALACPLCLTLRNSSIEPILN